MKNGEPTQRNRLRARGGLESERQGVVSNRPRHEEHHKNKDTKDIEEKTSKTVF
jgi:hypothetical protein